MDTFYIVPAETFDCDVILAADGSTERQFPSEVQEAHSPQAHYQRGSLREIEELGLTIPPSPQQNTNILPQRAYDRVQSYREAQSMQAVAQSTPIPHASQTEQGQVHRTAPVAAQGTSSGHLQVLGLWDQTLLQMSFDPNAPGEAFYQAFHRWAVRRNRSGDIERHRITLWLKTSRDTPDETAYELILKEGDLEDLWGMAVDWIQGNKNPKPPHLYATVELQAV
ncbi:hypothetical protein BU24DRAFT_459952 [Aaosphaeria arxii CBS 175.79]|uniref:Uncharacterized protein n=1 Tax=Aaosphaeria arxii CBS 175.79 TaxID=1450172 RepID=A0A6A5XW21_9PLEO|nr:uncharacterized protein BU24DRAFT_459952 [Aaosphaeria arxii CBS 175.79]KAF2016830.1 hypothetical protein BU24DRAFT_459952 [Aaosphaeria arxii CBS 175.79]